MLEFAFQRTGGLFVTVPDPLKKIAPVMGFEAPILDWLRKDLKEYGRRLVLDSEASRLYFRRTFLEKIWNEHQKGIRNWAAELWLIIMLSSWYGRFGK